MGCIHDRKMIGNVVVMRAAGMVNGHASFTLETAELPGPRLRVSMPSVCLHHSNREPMIDFSRPCRRQGSPMKGRGTGHRRTSSQGTMVAAYGPTSSVSRASSGAVPTGTPVGNPAAAGSGSHTSAVTSFGDVIPLDSAVPLGRLECGAEGAATVRLTSARSGLAQLSTLCLRDTITGAIYVPTHPYEVFVE